MLEEISELVRGLGAATVQQRGEGLSKRVGRGLFAWGSRGRMLTSETVGSLQAFVAYARGLEGNEKGEAQVYRDCLF